MMLEGKLKNPGTQWWVHRFEKAQRIVAFQYAIYVTVLEGSGTEN